MAIETIKISVTHPILPASATYTHTGTRFIASSTPNTFDVSSRILDHTVSTGNLLEHYFDHGMYEDEPIYVMTQYMFSNGTASNWGKAVPLIKGDRGVVSNANIIHTPTPTFKLAYDINSYGAVTINSTPMSLYAGAGEHISTSYTVTDSDNEVWFSRANDKVNLTSITVPVDKFKAGRIYTISVTHHSSTNAVSMPGRILMELGSDTAHVYDLITDQKIVPETFIYFDLHLYTSDFTTVDIYLVDESGMVVASNKQQATVHPRIFTGKLDLYRDYTIRARVNMTGGRTSTVRDVLRTTVLPNYIVRYNDSITYLDRMSYLQADTTGGLTTLVTRELIGGDILSMDQNGSVLKSSRIIDGILMDTGVAIGDLGSESMDKPDTNIIAMYNTRVVVDHSGIVNGEYYTPRFITYEYNTRTRVFTKINTTVRLDEVRSTAISSSAIPARDGGVYYVPSGEIDSGGTPTPLTLKYYHPDTGITDVSPLPISAYAHVSLGSVEDGGFYLIGGTDVGDPLTNEPTYTRTNDDVYYYDIETNTWDIVASLPASIPSTVYNFHVATRRDRKLAIFNSVAYGDSVGDQTVYTYDTSNDTFSTEAPDTADGLSYRSTISLKNGDIIRISNRALDPQKVMTYVSDTIKAADVIDTQTVDAIDALYVPAGVTITIESPYRFSSIVIGGTNNTDTGTLQWLDGTTMRTYNWNDLIITRDTVFDRNFYLPVRVWDSITVLRDVSFTYNDFLHVPENIDFTIGTVLSVDEITIGVGGSLTVDTGTEFPHNITQPITYP